MHVSFWALRAANGRLERVVAVVREVSGTEGADVFVLPLACDPVVSRVAHFRSSMYEMVYLLSFLGGSSGHAFCNGLPRCVRDKGVTVWLGTIDSINAAAVMRLFPKRNMSMSHT